MREVAHLHERTPTRRARFRLHVNIFDTENSQFRIPDSVIARPAPPTESFVETSDLVFNVTSDPFAFWVTRRDDANGVPLFDTRLASLPSTPIPPVIASDNSTALDAFPLVFEDQYLQVPSCGPSRPGTNPLSVSQLTSALPRGANIYGLGEVLASSGFRRDVGTDGGNGTVQTLWARDVGDPVDENVYGSHPLYLEHRVSNGSSATHGVFLLRCVRVQCQ